MQSRVPLPTDNIYKFYALFGLLLFLSCTYAFVNLQQSYNERIFKRHVELKTLQDITELNATQLATREILERQAKIDASDKKFFLNSIAVFFSIAILLMFYGFQQWHTKIQPQQDEILKRNLDKIDLEIKMLKKQINQSPIRK